MKWKSQQYSNVIKGGATLNIFIAFSIAQMLYNIKNGVTCCKDKDKNKVNNGQLNIGVYEICF